MSRRRAPLLWVGASGFLSRQPLGGHPFLQLPAGALLRRLLWFGLVVDRPEGCTPEHDVRVHDQLGRSLSSVNSPISTPSVFSDVPQLDDHPPPMLPAGRR